MSEPITSHPFEPCECHQGNERLCVHVIGRQAGFKKLCLESQRAHVAPQRAAKNIKVGSEGEIIVEAPPEPTSDALREEAKRLAVEVYRSNAEQAADDILAFAQRVAAEAAKAEMDVWRACILMDDKIAATWKRISEGVDLSADDVPRLIDVCAAAARANEARIAEATGIIECLDPRAVYRANSEGIVARAQTWLDAAALPADGSE